MRKFNVGDKVVTTSDRDSAGTRLYPVGTVGTVVEVIGDGMPYAVLAADGRDVSGFPYWYEEDQLVPCVEETEPMFKVGDKVVTRVDKILGLLFPIGTIGVVTKVYKTPLHYRVESNGEVWFYTEDAIKHYIEPDGEISAEPVEDAEILALVEEHIATCPVVEIPHDVFYEKMANLPDDLTFANVTPLFEARLIED